MELLINKLIKLIKLLQLNININIFQFKRKFKNTLKTIWEENLIYYLPFVFKLIKIIIIKVSFKNFNKNCINFPIYLYQNQITKIIIYLINKNLKYAKV